MQKSKIPDNLSEIPKATGENSGRRLPFTIQVWNVIYPIFIYFTVCEIMNLLYPLLPFLSHADPMVRQTVNTALGMLVIFRMFIKNDHTQQARGCDTKRLMVGLGMSVVLIGMASVAVNNLISATSLMKTSDHYRQVAQTYDSAGFFWQILALVLLAPVAEELLYRRIVFMQLKKMTAPAGAIFLSSLLFAVLHRNIVQGIYAMMIGLLLGLLMEYYGDIRIPILGHVVANFIGILRGRIEFLSSIDILRAIVQKGSIGYWVYTMIFLFFSALLAGILTGRIVGKKNN